MDGDDREKVWRLERVPISAVNKQTYESFVRPNSGVATVVVSMCASSADRAAACLKSSMRTRETRRGRILCCPLHKLNELYGFDFALLPSIAVANRQGSLT